ncbi:MAG: hypothetical protein HY786_04215 [Deltaproteobacteria bacterium]|nr:hypothetical protein [Deltaproteobacteria bacterium]
MIKFIVPAFLITVLTGSFVQAEENVQPQTSEVRIAGVEAGYKDNLYLKSTDNKFRLDIYGYGQFRYTYQTNDISGKEDLSNFQAQRTRLGFKGYVGSDKLKYQFLLSASQSGEYDKVSLLDGFVDYVPLKELGVQAGQFKVPYSTSWSISASQLQFVDRTQVDANFRLDRDNGLNLHGSCRDSMLTYNLGAYNGEGRNKSNQDNGMLYAARLMFEPFGKYAYHESDNEMSDKLTMLVSAAYAVSTRQAGSTNTNLNGRLATGTTKVGVSDVTGYDGFIGAKYRGASVHGEYFNRVIDPQKQGLADETAEGYYVQGGYFVMPRTVEVAARYEYLEPNKDKAEDLRKEYGIGVSYFVNGHKNKLQADFFKIKDEAGKTKRGEEDSRLRVQYQLAF